MKCCKCGVEQELKGKLSFRAKCDHCNAWLHCCINCKNYQPGLSNDCKIPGTESNPNREAMNFCEDFELLGAGPPKRANLEDISRRLFGD